MYMNKQSYTISAVRVHVLQNLGNVVYLIKYNVHLHITRFAQDLKTIIIRIK